MLNLKYKFQFKFIAKIKAIKDAENGQGLIETIWYGWNFVGIWISGKLLLNTMCIKG